MTQTDRTGLLAQGGEQSLPHARALVPARCVAARRRRRRRITPSASMLIATVAGLVGSGLVVLHGTDAAFTASTSNPADAWTAGTLVLSDDDSGAAMFSAGPLVPGATGSRCIAVTYSGDVTAPVKLYATGLAGTLGPDVDLTVEQGSVGTYANCSGYSSAATLYSGTLAGFAAASTSYATGVGSWAPTGSGQSRVYRFTWTLDSAVANSQQGASASATFVWEARA